MLKKKKKTKTKISDITNLIFAFTMLVILTFFLFNIYINIDTSKESNKNSNVVLSKTQAEISNTSNTDISSTIEKIMPSVVGISRVKNAGTSIFLNDSASKLGLGTGVVLSDNGYILTNEHVSGSKYGTCYITLDTGSTYTGTVVWSDNNLDLSIVKIKATGLQSIPIGNSDSVKIAQTVYAIGNPIGFEFQRTVTCGIISGINRTIKIEENNNASYMEGLIQTDATINPGNSGRSSYRFKWQYACN